VHKTQIIENTPFLNDSMQIESFFLLQLYEKKIKILVNSGIKCSKVGEKDIKVNRDEFYR